MSTSAVVPFDLHLPQSEIDDLNRRLATARLPEAETVASRIPAPGPGRWSQGVPLTDLVDFWRTDYSWRNFETRLNEIGQFRTVIDGLGIHFLHRRSSRPKATPLVLTMGGPAASPNMSMSSTNWPNRPIPRHRRSTASFPHCRVSASATSRAAPAGRRRRSPKPG